MFSAMVQSLSHSRRHNLSSPAVARHWSGSSGVCCLGQQTPRGHQKGEGTVASEVRAGEPQDGEVSG
jgi:hypothetical protein